MWFQVPAVKNWCTWGLNLLQLLAKGTSHSDDAISHCLELDLPCLQIFGVAENAFGDTSAMERRAGIAWTDDHLNLAQHLGSSVLISRNNVQGTDSFTVHTHILGVTLRDKHIESLFGEVPDWEGISDEISTSKSLVGRIEVGEQLLFLHNLSNLLPLIAGGINSGWVVGTYVQQHDIAGLCLVESVNKLANQSLVGFGIVVGVFAELEARSSDDVVVVGPSGVRNQNLGGNPFI